MQNLIFNHQQGKTWDSVKYWSRASDCWLQGIERMMEVGSSPYSSSAVTLSGNRRFITNPKFRMQSSVTLNRVFKDEFYLFHVPGSPWAKLAQSGLSLGLVPPRSSSIFMWCFIGSVSLLTIPILVADRGCLVASFIYNCFSLLAFTSLWTTSGFLWHLWLHKSQRIRAAHPK